MLEECSSWNLERLALTDGDQIGTELSLPAVIAAMLKREEKETASICEDAMTKKETAGEGSRQIWPLTQMP